MYETYFGLRERPFDLSPDPRFLALTSQHREALSNLRFGLTTPRGLTLLLGEAGTGKTTLVETILAEMDPTRIECVLVTNPTLTRAEFYEFLADGFGMTPDAVRSKARFLFELRRCLLARHEAGQRTAIILDEAQSLPHELLEEVRLLSNIETPAVKLLNVVLAGQPELADRLNDPALRQLKQRISLRCTLKALEPSETAAYIAGRLKIAGGSPAGIFTREAIEIIHELSEGLPRTINVICDNALISGFAAQVKPISRSLVEEVARDFDLVRASATTSPVIPARDTRVESAAATVVAPAEPPAAVEGAGAAPNAESNDLFNYFKRKRRFSFF